MHHEAEENLDLKLELFRQTLFSLSQAHEH